MTRLLDVLSRERRLLAQAREIRALRQEVEKLRQQNERMQAGMRRCLTCDYRLEALEKR